MKGQSASWMEKAGGRPVFLKGGRFAPDVCIRLFVCTLGQAPINLASNQTVALTMVPNPLNKLCCLFRSNPNPNPHITRGLVRTYLH